VRVGRTVAPDTSREQRDHCVSGHSRPPALIGADICVLALLASGVLASLVILTDESLETKPHMVLFQ
jgi:hypothetical protein